MQLINTVTLVMQHFSEMHSAEPEMQQLLLNMGQMIQQTMMALGVQQEPEKGGENAGGTQPGQKPAQIQEQPAQPFNTQTGITGNGFFA